jgi:hypothetical protein
MTEPRELLDAYAQEWPAYIDTKGLAAPKAFEALGEVLKLHRPETGPDDDGSQVCWKCRGRGDDWPDDWPCETVRAITDALT